MSRIVIDENRCKGCALCTTACPFGLIHIADRFNAKGYRPAEFTASPPGVHDPLAPASRCTGCANCAAMCPDVAITVYRTRPGPRARAGKLVPRKTGSPADHPHSKGNGRERQTLQAEPHPPTAPERR